METCENCGRSIGKLETPFVHGEHVVCAACKAQLAPESPPAQNRQSASRRHSAATREPSVSVESEDKMDFGKSFVKSHLSADEKVVFQTRLHWIMFVAPALLLLIFGLAGIGLLVASSSNSTDKEQRPIFAIVGGLLLLISILVVVSAIIRYFTTEYAVTSRRIIVKKGFLYRRSIETLLTKIESVNVDQGILDRMLGSGTLITVGTGGTHDPIRSMVKPLEFRRRMEEQIHLLEGGR